MNEHERYLDGVPCWIDLPTPDLDASARFYGAVFEWEVGPDGVARLEGERVAGLVSADAAGQWRTYVRAQEAGALTDGQGATLLLTPDLTAERVNAPGTWNWSDLHTTDLDAAARFYGERLGWEAQPVDFGGGGDARMLRRPGYGDHLARRDPSLRERHAAPGVPKGFSDAVGWLLPLQDGERPHWHVTFSVDDADAAARAAASNGGTVVQPPFDAGPTRVAGLADPHGARFTVSHYRP